MTPEGSEIRRIVYKERLHSLRYRILFPSPRVYTLIRCCSHKNTHTCFVDKQRSYKVTPVYCRAFFLVYRADIGSHIVGVKQRHIGEFKRRASQ